MKMAVTYAQRWPAHNAVALETKNEPPTQRTVPASTALRLRPDSGAAATQRTQSRILTSLNSVPSSGGRYVCVERSRSEQCKIA